MILTPPAGLRLHTTGMGAETSDLWRPVDPADGRLRAGLEAMMDARSRAIDAGERPIGWKIGWNAPAVRERLQVGSSVVGFLLASGVRRAGEPVPLAGTTHAGAEVELAIWAGPGATVGQIGPGIELVDVHGDFDDVPAALAANVWNRGSILGEERDWSPRLVDDIEVRIEHNGEPFGDPARPPDAIGDPEALVRFVAGTVAMLGEELREGDLILSGLLVPTPVWTKPGDRLVADYGPLGRLDVDFA
jgi:2-keto-4-pentenoate hydratase